MHTLSYFQSESDSALEAFEMEFFSQSGRCLLMPQDKAIVFELASYVYAHQLRGNKEASFKDAIDYASITPESGSALETAFEILERMEPKSAKALIAYFAQ